MDDIGKSTKVIASTGTKAAVGSTVGLAVVISFLSGAGSTAVVYLIKLFQILDILGNLSRMNT